MLTCFRALLMSVLLAFSLDLIAQAEEDIEVSAQDEANYTVGPTTITIAYPSKETASQAMVYVTFDEDVRVHGNDLPAGTYWVALQPMAEDDLHVVFSPAAKDGDGAVEELLRLAVRPDEAPVTERLEVLVEPIEPPEELDDEDLNEEELDEERNAK